jgi:hypothetical protein
MNKKNKIFFQDNQFRKFFFSSLSYFGNKEFLMSNISAWLIFFNVGLNDVRLSKEIHAYVIRKSADRVASLFYFVKKI